MLKDLPNKLCVLRILLSPVFFVLFTSSWKYGKLISLFLVIIIEATDLIDGIIARRTNQVTDFGKILDPFADKIAKLTYFLGFLYYQYFPIWMFLIIVYREFFLTIFRQYAERKNIIIAARLTGKLKSEVQAIGSIIIILLININLLIKPIEKINVYIYLIMLLITLITLLSIIDYIVAYFFLLKKINNNKENYDKS